MEPQEKDPQARRAIPLDEARRLRGDKRVAVPRSKVVAVRPFRRIRADRVLGIIGLIIVLVGAYAAVQYNPPPPEVATVRVEWEYQEHHLTTSKEGPNAIGASELADDGDKVVRTFSITDPNVTRVIILIETQDDAAFTTFDEDSLLYSIQAPASANYTTVKPVAARPELSNESFIVQLAFAPQVEPIPAATVDEARAKMGNQSSFIGVGDWVIEVTLVEKRDAFRTDSGRSLGQCPAGSPEDYCKPDQGQSVTIRFQYDTYAAKFAPSTPE